MARILFIDDDSMTLLLLTKAAQILGHRALTSTSGAEGLDKLASEQPDLVVVDLNLPDMDGLDFVQAVQAANAAYQPPVLIHSAGVSIFDEQRALAAGAREFLPKPVNLDQLADVISRYTAETV